MGKQAFIQGCSLYPSYQIHQWLLSLPIYEIDRVLTWILKKCTAFPISCTSAHTVGYISPKFREGFLPPCITTCHTASHSSRRDTARNALQGFECSLNSSCQSEACISCFRFFPGGFDVNPFHTSNTSVLLQAFLSFLSIQIYVWGKNFWLSLCSF